MHLIRWPPKRNTDIHKRCATVYSFIEQICALTVGIHYEPVHAAWGEERISPPDRTTTPRPREKQEQNADTLTEKVVKATCKRTLSASDLECFCKLVTCSFRSKGGNYSHMDQKNINTKHKARLLACWKDFSCIFLHWYRHSFKIWIFFGSQRICEKPEVHLMSVSCMRTRSPATTGGR